MSQKRWEATGPTELLFAYTARETMDQLMWGGGISTRTRGQRGRKSSTTRGELAIQKNENQEKNKKHHNNNKREENGYQQNRHKQRRNNKTLIHFQLPNISYSIPSPSALSPCREWGTKHAQGVENQNTNINNIAKLQHQHQQTTPTTPTVCPRMCYRLCTC